MKNIALLGSTGSIGVQSIEVIRRFRKYLRINALSAYSNIKELKKQIIEFNPEIVSVGTEETSYELKEWCKKNKIKLKVLYGKNGLIETASYSKTKLVISSVVGSIGLEPLLAAIDKGKDIALANKEALVTAGEIVMRRARKKGSVIIPVDSEHSAIFQCLKNESKKNINKILLTASGGPFYKSYKKQEEITLSEALAHPTWNMGKKITIDSATLMNKGLEAIEAMHLFDIPLDKIEIVIHPQSIVHSMVEFTDGSIIAQLSKPDMRLPIQYAITYPNRYPSLVQKMDFKKIQRLEFDTPDFTRFPCLQLALDAGRMGGTMPVVMNAANETAVEAFLNSKIEFYEIYKLIQKVMKNNKNNLKQNLKNVLTKDFEARVETKNLITNKDI